MKYSLAAFLLFSTGLLFAQGSSKGRRSISPLASYSNVWNDAKYSSCNAAANTAYLSGAEKDIVYILNLIRANPVLFTKTVLSKYPSVSGNGYLAEDSFYFISLVNTLKNLEPLNILYPDKKCFESAKCHAYTAGINGYVGHERKSKDCKTKKYYYGECCEYGHKDPLDIVLSLLIDEGIPSLGHRSICLTNYTKIGVATQPHRKYGANTVLDFYY
jgi:hypothetical protein